MIKIFKKSRWTIVCKGVKIRLPNVYDIVEGNTGNLILKNKKEEKIGSIKDWDQYYEN